MNNKELVVKHLELIQQIIQRQASNSFKIKSWTLALLVGIAGLSRASKKEILFISIGCVVIFWILDAYYLSKERKFRCHYDTVRKQKSTDFNLDISPYRNWKCMWYGALLAPSTSIIYGSMIIGILLFNSLKG